MRRVFQPLPSSRRSGKGSLSEGASSREGTRREAVGVRTAVSEATEGVSTSNKQQLGITLTPSGIAWAAMPPPSERGAFLFLHLQ